MKYLLLLIFVLLYGLSEPAFSSSENDLARLDFRRVITEAKEKVFPAVVFIKGVVEAHDGGEKQLREVIGSGVVVSPEGHVLTNWHVAGKAVEIRCQLFDGRALEARLIGGDQDVDLALLQLEKPEGSPPVPHAVLGDSSLLTEGDFSMAMGAPWGMSRSVSIGIISCARRYLPGRSEYSLWLQTDAPISPGNSGGPLVNTDGEVVGINTLAINVAGAMGFAIPSQTIKTLWPHLLAHGAMQWSWSGMRLQPIHDFNRNIYFDGIDGVVVADVEPDSPAQAAGIRPKDRLLSLNGEAINAMYEEDLPAARRRLALLPLETPADLTLRRNGQLLAKSLVPRGKGRVEGEALACPRWDFTVKAINQFADPGLYFYRKNGVYIFGMKHPGNAMFSGLASGDILLRIDGHEINSLEDVKAVHAAAMDNLENRTRLLIEVLRNGLPRQFVLDFTRDYSRE